MSFKNSLLIVCVGAILFIPFLGHVHLFDWDEINFAESAREMLVTHQYSQVQINFEPFYEKPPLFMWLQAISMAIFGVNEFAARFPNALIGIVTLLFIFQIGNKVADQRLGWLWVFCYIGSFLPQFYFKTGLIDPLFNIFIFLGIYQFVKITGSEPGNINKNLKNAVLAGVFIGLGILTKGPVALLVTLFSLCIYWACVGFKPIIPFKYLILFLVSAFVISCAWFGPNTIKNGPDFIFAFIERQVALFKNPDAGHDGPFYYHFIVILAGCFPASIFMFGSFKKDKTEPIESRNMKKWMIILLITVLFIFSIVRTKIIHYSSLAYFPVTFLAAYYLFKQIYIHTKKPSGFIIYPVIILVVILSSALAGLPYIAQHISIISPYITDKFGQGALHAKVTWTGWESLTGILYFILFITGLFLYFRERSRKSGAFVMLLAGALCIQACQYIFAPKIEEYSQKAAIDFLADKQKEDCYTEVWGYHSYAQYFYGAHNPAQHPETKKAEYLIYHKTIDKPVYIITKTGNSLEHDFHMKKLYEKNGFVFMTRDESKRGNE